ncbi:hypothetical protein GCM10023174_06720 [Chelativorans composti]
MRVWLRSTQQRVSPFLLVMGANVKAVQRCAGLPAAIGIARTRPVRIRGERGGAARFAEYSALEQPRMR